MKISALKTSQKLFQKETEVLRLARSENVGPRAFFELISLYGSAEKALDKIPELASLGGRRKIKVACSGEVEEEIEKAQKHGARIITYYDEEYPEILKSIYDPPPVITVLGNLALLRKPSIALVGARNASANGLGFAARLAKELGEAGFTIISGLARGIDTSAHKASVATGTVAVLAGGADNIYPPENKNLYKDIASKGLIISEQAFGMAPKPQNFPQRNRIISGLSRGVLVVEASLRSGSLITARMALEQGREVFSVPGFPLDPRCEGTNRLIKQGVVLVESAGDIINVLEQQKNQQELDFREDKISSLGGRPLKTFDEKEQKEAQEILLEKLDATPTDVNELINQTGVDVGNIMAVILELELAGKITRHPGNKVALRFE